MRSCRRRWWGRYHRRCSFSRRRLDVLQGKAQRALSALTDRHRDAERARDAKGFVDKKRPVRDGAYDEVDVDGLDRRARMRHSGNGIPRPSRG